MLHQNKGNFRVKKEMHINGKSIKTSLCQILAILYCCIIVISSGYFLS